MQTAQNDFCRGETCTRTRQRGRRFKTVLGKHGESLAAQFYLQNGYIIVAKNFRKKIGEIDLIAIKQNTIYFIEIKTLSEYSESGSSAEKITYSKKQKMIAAAFIFIQEQQLEKQSSHLNIRNFNKKFVLLEINLRQHTEPKFIEFDIF